MFIQISQTFFFYLWANYDKYLLVSVCVEVGEGAFIQNLILLTVFYKMKKKKKR